MNRKIAGLVFIIAIFTSVADIAAQQSPMLDPELLSIGTLTTSNLYLSYIALSTVGDNFIHSNYDAEITASIARETIFLNEQVLNTLRLLISRRNLSSDDEKVVYELIESYNLLIRMGNALINLVEAQTDASAFRVLRDVVWDQISDLIGRDS